MTDATMQARLAGAKSYTAVVLRTTASFARPAHDGLIWEHGRRNMALVEAGLLAVVLPVTDAAQHEDEAPVVAVLELPRAGVRDRLVGVLVREVVDVVIRHVDREPVLPGILWQSAGYGPRPEHPVLLEPQVGMATGATVVVQHEPAGRVARSLAHVDSLAAPRAGERVMACVSRERLTRFPLTDEAGTPDGIGRYNHHDQAGPGRR